MLCLMQLHSHTAPLKASYSLWCFPAPYLILVACGWAIMLMSCLYWGGQNTKEAERNTHFCQSAGYRLAHIAEDGSVHLYHKGTLLTHVHRAALFLPRQCAPSPYCCVGLFQPIQKRLHLPLLNIIYTFKAPWFKITTAGKQIVSLTESHSQICWLNKHL